MSLIEHAAKRLEELRVAGAEMPAIRAHRVAFWCDRGGHWKRCRRRKWPFMRLGRESVEPTGSPPSGRTGRWRRAPVPRVDAQALPKPSSRVLDIDIERLNKSGFVSPDSPKSQIADEFRVTKRPIIRNARRKTSASVRNGNLVMVTSALPGEGKTFTAVNLAISVAMEVDSTVLLVDGDVAHPSLPERVGRASFPGLLDLLAGDSSISPMHWSRPTSRRLSILPGGLAPSARDRASGE